MRVQLHGRDDRTHVDALVQRLADPQCLHAALQPLVEKIGNAFLDQQPRTRAADLPLIEPDRIDDAFHGAVNIGVVKNDER